jgi:2-polyprenyl-6-methoxyphenol hydroxylase-like FAD-dependent oxidoreductase
MGLKRPIWAYNPGLIYEVAFWGVTADRKSIQRTGISKSYPDHVDTRYPFTTILHQGRIEGIFLEDLRSHGIEVQRPWTIRAARYTGPGSEYPVDVELVSIDGLATETIKAKYLFGADGARSAVRDLFGIPMIYKDPTVHVWSVIDGVVKSDFPDMQVRFLFICCLFPLSAIKTNDR